jgi:hypothetical protein
LSRLLRDGAGFMIRRILRRPAARRALTPVVALALAAGFLAGPALLRAASAAADTVAGTAGDVHVESMGTNRR